MKLKIRSVQDCYIQGELLEADYNRTSTFEFTYDVKHNILHLLDRDDHHGASLINSIHSHLRDWFVFKLAKQDMDLERERMRCFLYQDNEMAEYVFEYEGKMNPFLDLNEMKDKELLFPPYEEYVKNWEGRMY